MHDHDHQERKTLSTEHEPRDWRRGALILIALGLMSVSIGGQVLTIQSRLGSFLAVVFAVGHDLAALLALDVAMRADEGTSIRKWAWAVVGLAAFTGGTINAYHILAVTDAPGNLPPLPIPIGLLIGIEPILLILTLSHLINLAVADARRRRAGDRQAPPAGDRQPGRQDRQAASAGDRQDATTIVIPRPPAGGAATASRDRQPETARAASPDRQPAPAARAASDRRALPAARQGATSPRARAPRTLAAVPGPQQTKRPGWMTQELIDAVVADMATALAKNESYGRVRMRREHGLNDHKAKAVALYIDEHDLLRETA